VAIDVCSLITSGPQPIKPKTYTIVRFPFGTAESTDTLNMHAASRGGTYGSLAAANWKAEDRAGLIFPSRSGWAQLTAMIQWDAGDSGQREYRDQFVRDPLGYTSDPVNTTATEHRPPSLGMQCFAKSWTIAVNPDTPLALRVYHDGTQPLNVSLAEFKLIIL
jgi:hypothetical protein